MNAKFVGTLVALAFLWGCATPAPPQLVTEPGASLTGYKNLQL